MTAKVTIDAVAKVAADRVVAGERHHEEEHRRGREERRLPISAIGMRTVSSSWNRALVRARSSVGTPQAARSAGSAVRVGEA